MQPDVAELFCLSCGCKLAEPLNRTTSLRCHDCRDTGAPISFELALRAREIRRPRAAHAVDDRRTAA